MSSFSELGLLYVYLMLIILIIGSGYLVMRWAISLAKWVEKLIPSNELAVSDSNKGKSLQLGWVKLSLISASILLLSVFSLGALKTIGAGSEGHQHQSTSSHINYQPAEATKNQLQAQIDVMLYQLNTMESNLAQASVMYP